MDACTLRGWPNDPVGRQVHNDHMVTTLDPAIAARLKRNGDGLIAAVVQQHDTREVLMMAWMDDQALAITLETGKGTYWSRSRGEYWTKGETSGNTQRVVSVAWTVMVTRFWSVSTKPVGPDTPATTPVSTVTFCSLLLIWIRDEGA